MHWHSQTLSRANNISLCHVWQHTQYTYNNAIIATLLVERIRYTRFRIRIIGALIEREKKPNGIVMPIITYICIQLARLARSMWIVRSLENRWTRLDSGTAIRAASLKEHCGLDQDKNNYGHSIEFTNPSVHLIYVEATWLPISGKMNEMYSYITIYRAETETVAVMATVTVTDRTKNWVAHKWQLELTCIEHRP